MSSSFLPRPSHWHHWPESLRSLVSFSSSGMLRWRSHTRRTYVGLVYIALGCSSRHPAINDSQLRQCSTEAGTGFVEDVAQPTSANHTELPLAYDDLPPTGGDHSACWGSWGIHTSPLAPEHFVHNMEHGGIVLLYNCPEGCGRELLWLEEFTSTHELTVLTEYPRMTPRFGISAWNARAYSDCLDPDFIRDFYERRVDRGPERFGRPPPDPPSSCP